MNNERIANKLVAMAKILISDDNRTEAYERLLKEVNRGQAILTAQELHKDIPTIHSFAGKYRNTVDHLGYGMFRGHTDHGNFTFDGGGAMNRTGSVSWCPLSADKAVLRDLKYSLPKVKRALKELLKEGITASERVAGKAITLAKIPGAILEREDKFMIHFRGKKWGELYYNMRGYVAERGIPVPTSGNDPEPIGLEIGEKSLAVFKREISKANREWASLGRSASSKTASKFTRYWDHQFDLLETALPHYNADKVMDWNKVEKHYRAEGMGGTAAGIPAHWFHEYKAGRVSRDDAVRNLAKEMKKYEKIIGKKTAEYNVDNVTEDWEIENAIRDHLSGTSRKTKENLIFSALRRQFRGLNRRVFSKIWKEFIDEGYLVPAGSGSFTWEM